MNRTCIVLACSTIEDLPSHWQQFSHIDCYGEIKHAKDFTDCDNVTIHNQFFEIGKNEIPTIPYSLGFIRHPDPWGEPRNWIKAIAGLSECLQGELVCEFWYPHEILAFHFLLTAMLDKDQVKFISAQQLKDIRDWNNFQASWQLNAIKLSADMLTLYQKEKQHLLQNFYTNMGPLYKDISLAEALDKIAATV